jgi:hypothetical protein
VITVEKWYSFNLRIDRMVSMEKTCEKKDERERMIDRLSLTENNSEKMDFLETIRLLSTSYEKLSEKLD